MKEEDGEGSGGLHLDARQDLGDVVLAVLVEPDACDLLLVDDPVHEEGDADEVEEVLVERDPVDLLLVHVGREIVQVYGPDVKPEFPHLVAGYIPDFEESVQDLVHVLQSIHVEEIFDLVWEHHT